MKFLFLITHYYPHTYGAEVFAQQLAEYLAKTGHQVDVITGQWQSTWKTQEKVNGVNLYRVKVIKLRFLQTLYFILPQLIKARKLVKTNQYDFIHAHIFPSLITTSLIKAKAKKIVTLQGGDLADYPEIYGPFAFLAKQIIKPALKAYSKIHVVSSDLAKQVKSLTGRSSLIIPNGVNSKIFRLKVSKPKIKLPRARYLAYSPSRLTEKNNLQATIKAIKLLRDKGVDIALAIAGTGHLERKLKYLVKTLRLQKHIVFLGYLEPKTNLQLVKLADLVIRVSLQEGFGIALLEALALKTPIITSQAGGLKDFISSQNAFISKNPHPQAIAQAINQCLTQTVLRKKKIQAGFNLVQQAYTWDKILPQFTKKVYGL